MQYEEFLKRKEVRVQSHGFDVAADTLNPSAFVWQRHIDSWALKKGRAALFEDCGLGKTLQQLIWADKVHELTGGPVMILSPLAVAPQTKQGEAMLSKGIVSL